MKPPGNPPIWKSQNGTQIPVKDMESEHILNTLRYLITRADEINEQTLSIAFTGPTETGRRTIGGDLNSLQNQIVSALLDSGSGINQWREVLGHELRSRLLRNSLTLSDLVKSTEKRNKKWRGPSYE